MLVFGLLTVVFAFRFARKALQDKSIEEWCVPRQLHDGRRSFRPAPPVADNPEVSLELATDNTRIYLQNMFVGRAIVPGQVV